MTPGDRKPAAGSFRLLTPSGRAWSRSMAWRVTTSAGEPHDVTALQEALRRAIAWQIGHGRHRATLAELAELVGSPHRGSVWHALARLRSLNLIAYRTPPRGRTAAFTFWIPRPTSARSAARARALRWPTRAGPLPDRAGSAISPGNVVTPTAYGGILTREGIRRSWRGWRDQAATPRPPGSPHGSPGGTRLRARRRPFPPRYVDEPCPSRGHLARLELARHVVDPTGDAAMVWRGRCRRDGTAIAAGVLLVADPAGRARTERAGDVLGRLGVPSSGRPAGLTSPGRPAAGAGAPPGTAPAAPDPDTYAAAIAARRHRLAAGIVADGDLPAAELDELRVRYLGFRRRELEHPAGRPAETSPRGGLTPDELEAITWPKLAADLELVRQSRSLDLPARDPGSRGQ